MGNINVDPKGLRSLANQIATSTQAIINECRSLDEIATELKSSLDSTTYHRIDNLLSQLEPSVKLATVNARTLKDRIENYAALAQKFQNG